MWLYFNGKFMGKVMDSKKAGEIWVRAQQFAEALGVSCALVDAGTERKVLFWEP